MAEDVSDLQDRYESRTSSAVQKWRSGVQNPARSVADGLDQNVNIDNFDEQTKSAMNTEWSNGADNDTAQNNYQNNIDGDKWARNFGDANNWSIGNE